MTRRTKSCAIASSRGFHPATCYHTTLVSLRNGNTVNFMKNTYSAVFRYITRGSLVQQIVVGLTLGILLALLSPSSALAVGLLGTLFVGGLKAVAPVLVLLLVMASITNHQQG